MYIVNIFFFNITGGSSSGFSDAPNLQNEGLVWWGNVVNWLPKPAPPTPQTSVLKLTTQGRIDVEWR